MHKSKQCNKSSFLQFSNKKATVLITLLNLFSKERYGGLQSTALMMAMDRTTELNDNAQEGELLKNGWEVRENSCAEQHAEVWKFAF